MTRPSALYYGCMDFQTATLDKLHEWFEVTTLPSPEEDTPAILAQVEAIFAPMGFAFDKAKLDACPRLKAIGTPTTGTPHIDVAHAARRGVAICSLREEASLLRSISATAELTWGLILCLTRHLPAAFDMVLAGEWDGKSLGRKTPRMLSALRLGIVGLGRLGAYVAGYGKAFGMEVGYYDPYQEDAQYTKYASVADLAARSDVLSLHVHSTPQTRGMIDREILSLLPKGAFVINTARGDLLDEAALLEGLENGHLGGAALDMLAGEHEPGFLATLPNHPLVNYAKKADNLILTPKYGGSTRDAWELTEARIVENLFHACTGEKQHAPA